MRKINKTSLPLVIKEFKTISLEKKKKNMLTEVNVKLYQSSVNYFESFHRPISKIIDLL